MTPSLSLRSDPSRSHGCIWLTLAPLCSCTGPGGLWIFPASPLTRTVPGWGGGARVLWPSECTRDQSGHRKGQWANRTKPGERPKHVQHGVRVGAGECSGSDCKAGHLTYRQVANLNCLRAGGWRMPFVLVSTLVIQVQVVGKGAAPPPPRAPRHHLTIGACHSSSTMTSATCP